MAADVGWLACLLRNMYERDVRQRYCPAALWLAPYSAHAGDGHEFEAVGVVGALLHAGAALSNQWEDNRMPAAMTACVVQSIPHSINRSILKHHSTSCSATLAWEHVLPPMGGRAHQMMRRSGRPWQRAGTGPPRWQRCSWRRHSACRTRSASRCSAR